MSPELDDRHPDELDLEAARLGGAPADVDAHLAGCDACRRRLHELRELGRAMSAPPEPIEVPAAREAEILDGASRASGRAGRRRTWRLIAIPAVAAAAALLVFLLIGGRDPSPERAEERPRLALPAADVNQDHTLDILDAFALARTIESGGATRPDWDFNHDNVIDALDVDCIAQLAVSVTSKLQGGPL